MAGFCELATSLQAPILGILGAKWPIVSGGHLKTPVFGRLRPETGFDLHCVAEATVQTHKISGITGSRLGISRAHCRAAAGVGLDIRMGLAVE